MSLVFAVNRIKGHLCGANELISVYEEQVADSNPSSLAVRKASATRRRSTRWR